MIKMKNNSVYKEAFKVSAVIFLLGLIEFIIFTAFLSLRSDIIIGVLYGCAFVSLNFFYLAYSVKKSVTKSENGAKAYMSATYSSRIFLTAVMIFVAAKVEAINIWAAIIPLIFTRIAVFIISLLNKRSENS